MELNVELADRLQVNRRDTIGWKIHPLGFDKRPCNFDLSALISEL